MTGKTPEQEPSIEEILASIRQIISDDDDTREPGAIEQPPEEKADIPVYQPEPEKEQPRPSFADVLDLTNEITEEEKELPPPVEEKFEIPVARPEPERKPEPRPSFDIGFGADEEDVFTQPAAAATTQAFSRLVGNVPLERPESRIAHGNGGLTLEDITRDLLRPMLRQWIDENVPRLVERLVEKELEKLARRARDD
jgi:hypothetical protein